MTTPTEAKKKILIVDDHPLVRQGMQRILESEPSIEVIGTAGNVSEALKQVESFQPDLVISDLALPDRNGLELIKDLKALHARIPVLVVSMHDEEIYAERILRAGGRGYMMKGSGSGEILNAIQTILSGGIYVSPATTDRFLKGMATGETPQYTFPLQRLSDRELEVFELIGQGKNTHEIAEQFSISPRTVDAHRGHIREKLDLKDSHAVMAYAIKWIESGNANSL